MIEGQEIAEPEVKGFWVVDVFGKSEDEERTHERHLKVQANSVDEAITEAKSLVHEELGDTDDYDFEAREATDED